MTRLLSGAIFRDARRVGDAGVMLIWIQPTCTPPAVRVHLEALTALIYSRRVIKLLKYQEHSRCVGRRHLDDDMTGTMKGSLASKTVNLMERGCKGKNHAHTEFPTCPTDTSAASATQCIPTPSSPSDSGAGAESNISSSPSGMDWIGPPRE